MTGPIVCFDKSAIHPGAVDKVKSLIGGLVAFVEANQSQMISYAIYLSEDESEMTVVQIHPDADSYERHMEAGGPAFREFAEHIALQTIEVYGEPSEKLIRQLKRKAEMLGGGPVKMHGLQAGFYRLSQANR